MRMTEAEYRAHQERVGRARQSGRPEVSTEPQKRAQRLPGKPVTGEKRPDYARMLAKQIKAAGLPNPVLEYAFDAQLDGSGRAWRFDLCWPKWLAIDVAPLAVEVDGAVHRIQERFKADLPKHQAAFELGYKLLRVSPAQVQSGEALEFIRRALT